MTKVELYAIGKSTTLESNKSQFCTDVVCTLNCEKLSDGDNAHACDQPT
jgi:hypothetical protein